MKYTALKQSVYEADTEFIPAHYQPALLVDLALSRGVDSRDLLRGVRLNLEQIKSAQKSISAEQFLTLITNAQKLLKADDSSFLYGQMLLPGLYGACSQAFQQMSNCRQMIEHLCDYQAILSPLLRPRLFENEDYAFIYWQDSAGANRDQLTFLIESQMMALVSMTDWLAGEKLPWQFQFSYSQPKYIEQYWVNFGENVSFNRQMNMLVVAKSHLDHHWSTSTFIGSKAVMNASRLQMDQLGLSKSFLDQVYDYLMQHICQQINLDRLSDAFLISPASMKRKLKKHNTGFQQQLDLARKNTAIYLFHVKGYSYQQIADYLQFNDMNNFRRSFKRWTGFSPSTLFNELSV